MHHVFEHFHIKIWQEIGESDLLLQTMRSEDWCYVSSFRAAPVLVVFAQRRQKSWKQLLWKQRKIAHNRLECFSFDVSFPTALEAAFQKFKDVCFWGCLLNSKTCLLLKARRYMKSAEAVEHAAKAWSFLKPVNFRKGDETWISMKIFMASKALTTEL